MKRTGRHRHGHNKVKPSTYNYIQLLGGDRMNDKTASFREEQRSEMMLFCREVPALSLSQSHGTVNAARLDPAAPCLSSTFSRMSDESEDYDSDGSDCIDMLVDAYRNMQNMFDEKPFAGYDATFDAYDANNANLDTAVATWFAALAGGQSFAEKRCEEAFHAATQIAETAMKAAYASAVRTQSQHNNRRRSD